MSIRSKPFTGINIPGLYGIPAYPEGITVRTASGVSKEDSVVVMKGFESLGRVLNCFEYYTVQRSQEVTLSLDAALDSWTPQKYYVVTRCKLKKEFISS